MNIHAEKLELVKLLLETNDKTTLDKVKSILKKEPADWWDEISQEEREEIKLAMQEADRGEKVPHSVAVERFGKWGLK